MSPLLTSRVTVHLPANRTRTVQQRWKRIMVNAAQQSEQWTFPRVTTPMNLPELVRHVPHEALQVRYSKRGQTKPRVRFHRSHVPRHHCAGRRP